MKLAIRWVRSSTLGWVHHGAMDLGLRRGAVRSTILVLARDVLQMPSRVGKKYRT